MKQDSRILFLAVALATIHSIAQVQAPPAQPPTNQAPSTYSNNPTTAPQDSSAQPLPDQTLTRTVPGVDNSKLPLSDQSLSNPYLNGTQAAPGTSGWMNVVPGARSMNEPQIYQQTPQQQNQYPQSQPAGPIQRQ